MLGYGESSKPAAASHYTYKNIAYDLNSLLDACSVPGKVVMVGHDWGGAAAWRFVRFFLAQSFSPGAWRIVAGAIELRVLTRVPSSQVDYFPHRVLAVAGICTPYQGPATGKTPIIPDTDFIRTYAPQFGYQLYFSGTQAADELNEVLDLFLQPMHSPKYRRQKMQPEDGKMANWVKEGRLQASIRRQIEARRAGTLPPTPAEPVSSFSLLPPPRSDPSDLILTARRSSTTTSRNTASEELDPR